MGEQKKTNSVIFFSTRKILIELLLTSKNYLTILLSSRMLAETITVPG